METHKWTGFPSTDKPWLKYYSEEAVSAPRPEGAVYEYLYQYNKDYFTQTALEYFGCNSRNYIPCVCLHISTGLLPPEYN